ncbi:NAD(P)-dependent oxidoreductase [Streptomyces sp. SID13031]|uniref:NAD-dependent epimerase/dehydratase family protein n=1 Tax=Streptomyces sp. SID13031 TaxID=2706046 RepID=UPI00194325DE|nr:NAD(P)-dependent oxidoreductase [Streptomyces sp. SID13031]
MILVTGGLGMIGAHTARALVDLGQQVVVTTHRRAEVPSFLTGKVTVEPLDVTDRDAFLALADRHAVTDILHLAGSIPGENPVSFFRTDLTGLLNALDAARAWGVRRFAVASSLGVYGGRSEIPWHEELDLPTAELPHPIIAFKKAVEPLTTNGLQGSGCGGPPHRQRWFRDRRRALRFRWRLKQGIRTAAGALFDAGHHRSLPSTVDNAPGWYPARPPGSSRSTDATPTPGTTPPKYSLSGPIGGIAPGDQKQKHLLRLKEAAEQADKDNGLGSGLAFTLAPATTPGVHCPHATPHSGRERRVGSLEFIRQQGCNAVVHRAGVSTAPNQLAFLCTALRWIGRPALTGSW